MAASVPATTPAPVNALNHFLELLQDTEPVWCMLPVARGMNDTPVSMPLVVCTPKSASTAKAISEICGTQAFASIKNACTRLLKHMKLRLPKNLSDGHQTGDKDTGYAATDVIAPAQIDSCSLVNLRMKMLLKVSLVNNSHGVPSYDRASPTESHSGRMQIAVSLALFGIPFCALQRNKQTRRKDAALRQDSDILALVSWLNKAVSKPVARPSHGASRASVKWSGKTAACVDGLRHRWQMCQSSNRSFDMPELCHMWLSTLQESGFLELNKEAMPSLTMTRIQYPGYPQPVMQQQWSRPPVQGRAPPSAQWRELGQQAFVGSAPSSVYSGHAASTVQPMLMQQMQGPPHDTFADSYRIMQPDPAHSWAGGNISSAAAAVHNGMHPSMAPRHESISQEFSVSGFKQSARPSAASSVFSASGGDSRPWTAQPANIPGSAMELQRAPKPPLARGGTPSSVHARPQPVSVRLNSFVPEAGTPSPSHLHRFPKASSVVIPHAPRMDFGAHAVVYLGQSSSGTTVVNL